MLSAFADQPPGGRLATLFCNRLLLILDAIRVGCIGRLPTAKPKIDEATANRIILEMDYCGFGTIASKTLRQALDGMLADWKNT